MPKNNQQHLPKGIYLEFSNALPGGRASDSGKPLDDVFYPEIVSEPYLHAYLVYRDGKGGEQVLRGGPEMGIGFGDIQIQSGDLSDSMDGYTATNKMSDRLIQKLPVDEDRQEETWRVMSEEVKRIEDADLDYDLAGRDQNSNSVVAAAMHKAGMKMEDHLPQVVDPEQVPGMENTLQPGDTNEDRERKQRPIKDRELRRLLIEDEHSSLLGDESAEDTDEDKEGMERKPSPDPYRNEADEDSIRKLGASLTHPGDAVDEALLKDDLTEAELSDLMRSKAYLSPSDPRHGLVQGKVRQLHESRWGKGPAKTDATGRIRMDEKPEVAAPRFPGIPVERPTGRPLDEAVGEISRTVVDRARKSSPFEAVKTLQRTLNEQEDSSGRPTPLLKTDGVAGPKTRRALRFATQRLGAGRLLDDFRTNAFRR